MFWNIFKKKYPSRLRAAINRISHLSQTSSLHQ